MKVKNTETNTISEVNNPFEQLSEGYYIVLEDCAKALEEIVDIKYIGEQRAMPPNHDIILRQKNIILKFKIG